MVRPFRPGPSLRARVERDVRMETLVARLRGRWLWLTGVLGTALAAFIVGCSFPIHGRHFGARSIWRQTIDIDS